MVILILSDFYNDEPKEENKLCGGCSILEKDKPFHSYMDHEEADNQREVDVLFVSDSFKYDYGDKNPFSKLELIEIEKNIAGYHKLKFGFTASVKCPSVKEADLQTKDIHICRKHIEASVAVFKPKLIFACGNLALKMLTKKSGIEDKRGSAIKHVFDNGMESVVVPIYHPLSVSIEPKLSYLFSLDIKNSIEKYILKKSEIGTFKYDIVDSEEKFLKYSKELKDYTNPVAVDIETTGLDFLRDKIQTISIATDEVAVVFPIDHKDSPNSEELRGKILEFLSEYLRSDSIKVLQNCKFDWKFLYRYNIHVNNMWDTKSMAHILDENTPKGLSDLVKEHFPEELEDL